MFVYFPLDIAGR